MVLVDYIGNFFRCANTFGHIQYLSRAPEYTPVLVGFVLIVQCFVDRCLSFLFWPLCCLSFFELGLLNTPLVSSISYYPLVNEVACEGIYSNATVRPSFRNLITLCYLIVDSVWAQQTALLHHFSQLPVFRLVGHTLL